MLERKRKKSKLYSTARWKHIRRLALHKSAECMYCFRLPPNQIDHLDGQPGNNHSENLIPCCQSCHSKKTFRVETTLRLYHIKTLHDALVYVAKKLKHNVTIPDTLITTRLTDELEECQDIIRIIKGNSMDRPECYKETTHDINLIRYVLALAEIHNTDRDTPDHTRPYFSKDKIQGDRKS